MSPVSSIGPRHQQPTTLGTVISVVQLVVLVVGVGGIFQTMGRKDAILERQDRDLTEPSRHRGRFGEGAGIGRGERFQAWRKPKQHRRAP